MKHYLYYESNKKELYRMNREIIFFLEIRFKKKELVYNASKTRI
jgi:hypothetical protein